MLKTHCDVTLYNSIFLNGMAIVLIFVLSGTRVLPPAFFKLLIGTGTSKRFLGGFNWP